MTDPDVTLTDYAIALECAVFCVLAMRWAEARPGVRRWWLTMFASIAAGALFGGTVHGFFLDPDTAGYAILWPATLLALGVTSTAMWFIGARLQLREPVATWVRRAAVAQLLAYAAIVLFVDRRFVVAIATYLPATVFLIVVMTLAYRRARSRPAACAVVGLALTFVAAAVQQLGIAIHPVYFDHNALYHVIQGVALLLIFLGARWTVSAPPLTWSPT
ncbi:MAG TPA: hypothetical protein VMN78_09730 [Longimicrobiales bacterium]|nr:hypothetical protein [Longimicrobiales bacterium]